MLSDFPSIVAIGIYIHNQLVAFNLAEELRNSYYTILFQKTDPSYTGISEYILKKTCQLFYEKGQRYLNFMQDIGIPSLRQAKELWKPTEYLKKYKISLND